ncbi:MAG: class I adenylate cyclase [Spirochaetota bacterium]|nr:class I adenylate cyclase [Spirochaetota bacterium]
MEFLELIENNKQKYLFFNEIKFQRFQQLLTNLNTKRIINSIPFLLSLNNKKLPGYVEGETPFGIVNYEVDEDTKRFIRSKFPVVKFEINKDQPFIEMVAVMGSIGTIAYNKKSDFDYWICINSRNVSKESLERFREKVEAIQKWIATEIDASVHLFINDVENIKQNIFAEDTEEAFGSTTGAVLKDEFFRSSIIITGKVPFWWVIPRFVRDDEYEKLYQRLPEEKRQKDFIDLGNLYEISREDFLGAALFQIIKSLGNPFKSIIKIGVLEKYLFGSDDSPLLSQRVKINIQREQLNDTILDSYLLMFQEVYDYYNSSMEDKTLLNILKQNLYLKIAPQLSKYMGVKAKKSIPYKVEVMFRYVKEWGWDDNVIQELDNFDNWDFNKIMKFWDLVKRFMLLSYQRISMQLPSLNLAKKISETDFMLLSRKIKTHFSREKDKIEQFITFKDTPFEAILYVEPVNKGLNESEWRLYKRNTSEEDTFVSTTIRTEKSILRLLVWTVLNQIYDHLFTRLNIQSGYSRIDQSRIMELLNQMSLFFTGERIYLKNEYFFNPAFNLLNFIIINYDNEVGDSIKTIHYLYHTSWGESFLKEYYSDEVLSKILFMILRDGLKLKRGFDDYCAINTPEPHKKLYKRITNMFKEAYSFIVEKKINTAARYVTNMNGKYIVITRDGEKIDEAIYPNIISLISTLTLRPKREIVYKFYGDESLLSALNRYYDLFQRDSISIAYEERGDFVFAYIINESGNIFVYFYPLKAKDEFLVFLYGFCLNIIKRVKQVSMFSNLKTDMVNVYCLRTDRFGKLSIIDESNFLQGQHLLKYNTRSTLVASISKHKGKETLYNIVGPGDVSSDFIAAGNFHSLSGMLNELRDNAIHVNIIRDLVFTDLRKEEAVLGSTLYFLEKYKLELLIEKAMRKN